MTTPQLTRAEESILLSLIGRRLYGLQINDAIHQSTGQCLYGQGRLYSILAKLEKRGFVFSEKNGEHRYYELTDDGADELDKINNIKKKLSSWQPPSDEIPVIKTRILSK